MPLAIFYGGSIPATIRYEDSGLMAWQFRQFVAIKNYDFSIETSRTGEHVIGFPRRYEDLIAPVVHEAKMAWIRSSFQVVLEHIRQREALLAVSSYN